MQIVQDIGSAQELQQSKAGVSNQMDEREGVPANRDFYNDDPHLCEGRIRKRRFHITLRARRDARVHGDILLAVRAAERDRGAHHT